MDSSRLVPHRGGWVDRGAVLLLQPWLGTPRTIFFNLVSIPAHQPFLKVKLLEAFEALQFQGLIFLLLPLVLGAWRMTRPDSDERRRPEWLLSLTALAMSVTGVMGMIKFGGNINAMTPPCYFALLAFCYSLCSLAPRRSPGAELFHPAILAMCGLAILFGPIYLMKAVSSLRHISGPSLLERAYRFDRQHPGEVYFPEYPLAVLDAEGRLYNFSWGLEDRAIAGYKAGAKQVYEYMPATDLAAIENDAPYMNQQLFSICHEDATLRPPAALQGFRFCKIERPGGPSRAEDDSSSGPLGVSAR